MDYLFREIHSLIGPTGLSRLKQKERLEARREDPLKQWKISPIDACATEKWAAYSKARTVSIPNAPIEAFGAYWAVMPPSILNSDPVTNLDSSDAR